MHHPDRICRSCLPPAADSARIPPEAFTGQRVKPLGCSRPGSHSGWGVPWGGGADSLCPPSLWNSVAFPVFPGPLPGTHHRYTQVPTWWTRLSFWRQAGEQKSSRAWPEVPGDPEAGPLSESLFSGMRARHQACKQYRALGKRSTPACCLCLLLPVPGIAHVWVRALLLRGWDCRGVTGSRSLTP